MMKMISSLQTAIKAVLILWFVIAMVPQNNVGLADNGDFTRSMEWISSGPVGIEPNWPAAGTEDSSRRFFNFWLPFWKLEWNIQWPTTSALLLWLPGALVNYFVYSSKVLYLPILAFFPKLILFSILLLLFNWIKLDPNYTTILLFSIGVPVVLIFTNTEYVAYFNSFYQESASLIFLVVLLASILLLKQHSSFAYLLYSLASILLLATAKPANLYWPFVAVPFVLYVWSIKRVVKVPTMMAANLLLIFLFTFASVAMTNAGSTKTNPYHSLFVGVLAFSGDPSAHLHDLGMNNATQCINTLAFSPVGSTCLAKYQNQISFKNMSRVIYKEPAVIFRMWKHALDNMQDVSLDYLGRYSFFDTRSYTSPNLLNVEVQQQRFQSPASGSKLLNPWTRIKFKFFPIGYALALTLIGFLIWFTWKIKDNGIQQDLALVGLLSTIACIADTLIAILGDGKSELIKHLLLSNILFDIALVAFLNSVLLFGLEFLGRRSSNSNFQKATAA
jgi:hypothetical protein